MREVVIEVFGGLRFRGWFNPDTRMIRGPRGICYGRRDVVNILEGSLD
jgi:hypothetical protein